MTRGTESRLRTLVTSGGRRAGRRRALSGALLAIVAVAAGCSGGSMVTGGDDDEPDPPSARPLGNLAVGSGPSPCSGETCWDVVVSCPEVSSPRGASVVVGAPVGAVRGTILFFSGSDGTGFWEGGDAEARRVLNELASAGFRTVRVAWDGGWLVGTRVDEDHVGLACRPATLTSWVHEVIHEGGGFCATGNSGGAAQVSYLLSHYGLDEMLDLVVPTEGPPMARVDIGCLREDTANQSLWYGPGARGLIDRAYGFGPGAGGPCETADPAFEDRFRASSVVNDDGDYEHPRTRVHFLMGGLSESEAQDHGVAYFDRLAQEGGEVFLDVVPNTNHRVQRTAAGADAIRDVLLAECVAR